MDHQDTLPLSVDLVTMDKGGQISIHPQRLRHKGLLGGDDWLPLVTVDVMHIGDGEAPATL